MPWVDRATTRWGHWGSALLVASIGASVVLGLHPLPVGTPQAVGLPVALMILVIVSWLMMRRHDRQLCEHCVAAMPLNPAEQAQHHRRRLHVVHLGSHRAVVAAYLFVLIGSNALIAAGTPGRILWALVQCTMLYLVLAYSSHRNLQPWCPWSTRPATARHLATRLTLADRNATRYTSTPHTSRPCTGTPDTSRLCT
jgi:hypothetical protein